MFGSVAKHSRTSRSMPARLGVYSRNSFWAGDGGEATTRVLSNTNPRIRARCSRAIVRAIRAPIELPTIATWSIPRSSSSCQAWRAQSSGP